MFVFSANTGDQYHMCMELLGASGRIWCLVSCSVVLESQSAAGNATKNSASQHLVIVAIIADLVHYLDGQ